MNNTDKGKEGKSQINRTICFFFFFFKGGGGAGGGGGSPKGSADMNTNKTLNASGRSKRWQTRRHAKNAENKHSTLIMCKFKKADSHGEVSSAFVVQDDLEFGWTTRWIGK